MWNVARFHIFQVLWLLFCAFDDCSAVSWYMLTNFAVVALFVHCCQVFLSSYRLLELFVDFFVCLCYLWLLCAAVMLECIRHEKMLFTIIICRDIGWVWTLSFCVGVCCSHGEQGVFARVWLPCVCGVCSPPFWLGLLEFKEPLSFLSPPSSFSHPSLSVPSIDFQKIL